MRSTKKADATDKRAGTSVAVSRYAAPRIGVAIVGACLLSHALHTYAASDSSPEDLQTILDFARTKWKQALKDLSKGPFGAHSSDYFCTRADRIELPKLCGIESLKSDVRLFLVQVVDIEDSRITDTIARTDSLGPWSVLDDGGFERLVDQVFGQCHTRQDLLELAGFQASLLYASPEEPHLWCGAPPDALRGCEVGDVFQQRSGLILEAYGRPTPAVEWVHWRFMLSEEGEYKSDLVVH